MPIYEFVAGGGCFQPKKVKDSLRRQEQTLPSVAPRLIMDSRQSDSPRPVRVYSDATGDEGLASLTFMAVPERPAPIFLVKQAQESSTGWLRPPTQYAPPNCFQEKRPSLSSVMSYEVERYFRSLLAKRPAHP